MDWKNNPRERHNVRIDCTATTFQPGTAALPLPVPSAALPPSGQRASSAGGKGDGGEAGGRRWPHTGQPGDGAEKKCPDRVVRGGCWRGFWEES